jgi:RNA polymerase sigma factor for flagellar operon FliA
MDENTLLQPMPTYYAGTKQGALFETLRLLAETHDDVEEVAHQRRESVQAVLARLRSNGVKILTPEELAKNHYEKAKKACEDVKYDRRLAAENLKISVYTLVNWLRGGPKLPLSKRQQQRKEITKKRAKKVSKSTYRLRRKQSKKLQKTHPAERGLMRLSFLPEIQACIPNNIKELMDLYISVKGTSKEKECLEQFHPLLKLICIRRAWKFGYDAPDFLYFAFSAMKEVLNEYNPKLTSNPGSWLYGMICLRITDRMRDEDHRSRSFRTRVSQLKKLEEHGSMTDELILAETGWSQDILREVRETQITSLDLEIVSDKGRTKTLSSLIVDDDPWEAVRTQEEVDHIICKAFPSERELLSLYFLEDMTMKEIGAKLQCSESRISQRMADMIARLRETLQN